MCVKYLAECLTFNENSVLAPGSIGFFFLSCSVLQNWGSSQDYPQEIFHKLSRNQEKTGSPSWRASRVAGEATMIF